MARASSSRCRRGPVITSQDFSDGLPGRIMDGPMRWTGLIRGVVLATSVVPPTHVAHAGDGVRLRTPVRWPSDIDCLRIVDRSSTPVWNLPYEIAAEDPPRG